MGKMKSILNSVIKRETRTWFLLIFQFINIVHLERTYRCSRAIGNVGGNLAKRNGPSIIIDELQDLILSLLSVWHWESFLMKCPDTFFNIPWKVQC